MISLLSFSQRPEFREARNPEKFRNITEEGSHTTALIGVGNQVLLIDVSSSRLEHGGAL
jgi:hypothetical protein